MHSPAIYLWYNDLLTELRQQQELLGIDSSTHPDFDYDVKQTIEAKLVKGLQDMFKVFISEISADPVLNIDGRRNTGNLRRKLCIKITTTSLVTFGVLQRMFPASSENFEWLSSKKFQFVLVHTERQAQSHFQINVAIMFQDYVDRGNFRHLEMFGRSLIDIGQNFFSDLSIDVSFTSPFKHYQPDQFIIKTIGTVSDASSVLLCFSRHPDMSFFDAIPQPCKPLFSCSKPRAAKAERKLIESLQKNVSLSISSSPIQYDDPLLKPYNDIGLFEKSHSTVSSTILGSKFKGTSEFQKNLILSFQRQFWIYIPKLIVKQGSVGSVNSHVQIGNIQGDAYTSSGSIAMFKTDMEQTALVGMQSLRRILQDTDTGNISESLRQWYRNTESQVLIRCLGYMAFYDCMKTFGIPSEVSSTHHIKYVLQTFQPQFQQIMTQHMNVNLAQQENVHPHPIVSLKKNLHAFGNYSIFNPFVMPLPLALPILVSIRLTALQMFIVDGARSGDKSTLFFVGKPGSGKSTILDGLGKYFRGYYWNKKGTNFQNQDVLTSSVAIIDEFTTQELTESNKSCNDWKLRFDQLRSSHCDFKGKNAVSCTKFMPMICATNNDFKSFKTKLSPAIHRRLNIVYFPCSFNQVYQQMKSFVRDEQVFTDAWAAFQTLPEATIQDMQINLLMLMPLLFPQAGDNPLDTFFLDDAVITRMIQIMWSNRSALLMRVLSLEHARECIQDMMDDYQAYTNDTPSFICQKQYFIAFYQQYDSVRRFQTVIAHLFQNHNLFSYLLSDPFAVFFSTSLCGNTQLVNAYDRPNDIYDLMLTLPQTNLKHYIINNWSHLRQAAFTQADLSLDTFEGPIRKSDDYRRDACMTVHHRNRKLKDGKIMFKGYPDNYEGGVVRIEKDLTDE